MFWLLPQLLPVTYSDKRCHGKRPRSHCIVPYGCHLLHRSTRVPRWKWSCQGSWELSCFLQRREEKMGQIWISMGTLEQRQILTSPCRNWANRMQCQHNEYLTFLAVSCYVGFPSLWFGPYRLVDYYMCKNETGCAASDARHKNKRGVERRFG